jgi:hypothetical protein
MRGSHKTTHQGCEKLGASCVYKARLECRPRSLPRCCSVKILLPDKAACLRDDLRRRRSFERPCDAARYTREKRSLPARQQQTAAAERREAIGRETNSKWHQRVSIIYQHNAGTRIECRRLSFQLSRERSALTAGCFWT